MQEKEEKRNNNKIVQYKLFMIPIIICAQFIVKCTDKYSTKI